MHGGDKDKQAYKQTAWVIKWINNALYNIFLIQQLMMLYHSAMVHHNETLKNETAGTLIIKNIVCGKNYKGWK